MNGQQTNKTEKLIANTGTSLKKQGTSNSTDITDTDTAKASVLLLVKGAYDKYFEAAKSSDVLVWVSSRAEFEKSITTELADEWKNITVATVDPILCIQNMPASAYLKYSDVELDGDTATIVVTGVFNAGTQYASESPITVNVNTLTNKIASITCE